MAPAYDTFDHEEPAPSARRRRLLPAVAAASAVLAAAGLVLLAARPGGPSRRPALREAETGPKLRKAIFINCDFSKDRLALQEKNLKMLGVPYERFPCVSGDTMEVVKRSFKMAAAYLDTHQIKTDQGEKNDKIIAHTAGDCEEIDHLHRLV